ncbi:MAG: hypothetical protein IIY05_04145 [Alistipes sp.]|nr:hypothetical protein [Alistipes sp.]
MGTNWQNIAVGIILVMVVAWLIRALLRTFSARRYTRCGSCDDAACPYRNREEDCNKKGTTE